MSSLRSVVVAVAVLFAGLLPARSQTAPVAKLDVSRFVGAWHTIERYPIRRQKQCGGDEQVLYALGDKRDSFLLVTSCLLNHDNWNYWDQSGKLDGSGGGRLRLTFFLFLHSPYWVLATAPDYSWALVGTPNHKSLWVLAKAATLPPEVLSEIRSQAAAQGFDPAKLVSIPVVNTSQTRSAP